MNTITHRIPNIRNILRIRMGHPIRPTRIIGRHTIHRRRPVTGP